LQDIAGKYTLGYNVIHASYQDGVVRHDLTRKLPSVIPNIVEETQEAIEGILDEGDGKQQ
jgi:hypothetical protein